MHTDKEKLFTIGQFAALHEITKKTLMWYDETGLLKPAAIGDNGYRYYTYYQSATLETILMLRELDVSIPDIREFMQARSAEGMERLLGEKIAGLDEKIAQLEAIRATLAIRRQNMTTLLGTDLSQIDIIEKEAHAVAVVRTGPEASAETEIEKVIAETKKYQLNRLHDASYGSMIAVASLYSGKFDDYAALFIELPKTARHKDLHVKPAGRYLRAFCKGDWDRLPKRYAELLAYAQAQGIVLCGYAYETGINEDVIDAMDDYITQIEIPVCAE